MADMYPVAPQQPLQFQTQGGGDDSQRNLIVNFLPSTLTPADFKNMFVPFGEVESCRIIFDKATGSSLGYGFVKFTTNEAAANAAQTMNGQVLENKTLKVSLARAASASMQQANLYVANLPKHYSKSDLEQMFANYGPLLETKVLLDPTTGVSKGVGFVRFASKEHAQVAVDSMHNQTPLGADGPIVVRFSDSKEDKIRKGKVPTSFGIRGGLRYNPMAAAAAATSYPAATPDYSGMYPPQMAAAAAAATPMAANYYAYCLFVYNLPPEADEGLLYRLFGPFGAISDAKIVREPSTNLCKGFGFVHYLRLEEAQQAIMSMNGYQLGNKYLQVSFKKQK